MLRVIHGACLAEVGCALPSVYLKLGHIFLFRIAGSFQAEKLYRHLLEMNTFSVEKGVTIRYPATANLFLDSADRNSILDSSGQNISTPWDFVLSRQQPLINGFFNRIGTTEVVLEWCLDNISPVLGNDFFGIMDTSGNTVFATLPAGAYRVQEVLDTITNRLNFACANNNPVVTGYDFNILVFPNGQVALQNDDVGGREFRIMPGKLARQLSLNNESVPTPQGDVYDIECPDIRPYRFIDFVCDQIVQVQDVRDASTQEGIRDSLCRYYFADDAPNTLDSYGFPILMGYTRFCQRRLFNPPKQIKWDNNLPLGGFLRFSVYGDDGKVITEVSNFSESNWLMTLQFTEN